MERKLGANFAPRLIQQKSEQKGKNCRSANTAEKLGREYGASYYSIDDLLGE